MQPLATMSRIPVLSVVLILLLVTGCVGAREARPALPAHPLAGSWDYTLDTPQGVYKGVISFTETAGALAGSVAMEQAPDEPASIDSLMFDAEASMLKFSFDSGEFGVMEIELSLTENELSGVMNVVMYGFEVPMVAVRQEEQDIQGDANGGGPNY